MVNHKYLPEPIFRLRKKLYIKAKQEPTFRFYTLYDRIYRQDVLAAAWDQVVLNNGSPGVDGLSIQMIQTTPEREAAFLEEIHKDNSSGQPLLYCIRGQLVEDRTTTEITLLDKFC